MAVARQFGGAGYSVADATALPFATASLDAVVFYDVLEHIPDAEGCLAEVARVLRPGGLLAATVPVEGQPGTFEWLRWRLGWHADLKAVARGHVHRFRDTSLRAMLCRHGLRPVRWHYSFHLLGQVWDFWYYYAERRWGGVPGAPTTAPATPARRLRWGLLRAVFGPLQRAAYWESRLLARVAPAMAVDFACRKTEGRPAASDRTGAAPAVAGSKIAVAGLPASVEQIQPEKAAVTVDHVPGGVGAGGRVKRET
jgi:SAM-dependent methyltransferase